MQLLCKLHCLFFTTLLFARLSFSERGVNNNNNINGAISAHPIVIVSNNHNNHAPVHPALVNSNHFDALLNSSDGAAVYLTDSEDSLDNIPSGEYTTNSPNMIPPPGPSSMIPGAFYPGNSGSILSLDESILASMNQSDPYSGLYFTGESVPSPQYNPVPAASSNSHSIVGLTDRMFNNMNTTTPNPLLSLARPPDSAHPIPSPTVSSGSSSNSFPSRAPAASSAEHTKHMNTTSQEPSSHLSNQHPNIQYPNGNNNGDGGKPRWIDYRTRPPPAFPPRVPGIHGIPSGFRNPPSSSSSNSLSSLLSASSSLSSMGATTSLSPATVTTVSPFSANGHINPQVVHAFGPSSSNPVGFAGSVPPVPGPSFPASNANQDRRRPMPNITRVEHIAAECSDDYMKVTIHYNGTFTGLVYSSGYVHDPNCIYVNGTGRNHYEFFIRLNQCGTLGRQEMYHPKRPGEVRRRDQVMWNTLSIQYNPMIEEEWDEHYRVTCEYGSDFWKTVTFPAVNVEVNTGSPVVFTINPPQCQMEVRRGFGTAGSRTSGPVTVGDPLTLLIHMKSEKAGFDILVKNCIAHNGAQQRLQLIDPNGCVTNEKLISPFRGTYNADDGHQVSLYAYLKAFRFTGSPALYLECDIHMCHNKCPPQRCYWRNLSKRSVRSLESNDSITSVTDKPAVMSESISLFQALEVRHEPEDNKDKDLEESKELSSQASSSTSFCFRPDSVVMSGLITIFLLMVSMAVSVTSFLKMRRIRKMYESVSSSSSCHSSSSGSGSVSGVESCLFKQHTNLSYDNLLCPYSAGSSTVSGGVTSGTYFNRRRF